MGNYRFIVNLPYTSGLPEDVAVNVFHAVCTDDAAADEFILDLIDFYNVASAGQTNPIAYYLGSQLSRAASAVSIRAYDLADTTPRVPTGFQVFTLEDTAPGDILLPAEVALCLSFQGDPVSGQPQARRRGRVYLGPLNGIVLSLGMGEADVRPTGVVLDDFTAAGDELMGTAGRLWSVWSPTDQAMVTITNGWVDNAFDTQRRRGVEPTGRIVFP